MHNGVWVVKGDQTIACKCYIASCKAEKTFTIKDQRDEQTMKRAEPVEKLISIPLEEGEDKVSFNKSLGFMVLHKGIKADPEKIKAIQDMAAQRRVKEDQDNKQLPIYYVSKVLQKAELRYPNIEKLAYAPLVTTRKLYPYFQSHSITVLTDMPLRWILHKHDLSGRLVPWSCELGEFHIQYRPHPSIKGQALADFVVNCALPIKDRASSSNQNR
ncbi:hypothetical protein RJ639_007041 [Escallonia herrerae]|uniref:Reverse transcriptase RNase H-like domain-containing protein n=1 Tax=Escallonia herrerae TaxID=1293975 RepID=A0AA88VTD5_9ASTE|nr:hypothetical protein RJ639_007041 [Escallonia herrerae]